MRSPQKRQGSVPQRGVAKTALFSADNQDIEMDSTDTSNSSNTIIPLESNDKLSEDNSSAAAQIVGTKYRGAFIQLVFCLKNV